MALNGVQSEVKTTADAGVKRHWFRPWGWVYRPVSWQAVLACVLTLTFCVHVFVAVDRRSHSVSDTLYGIFPFVVPAFMVLNWIASKTSEPSKA